MVPHRRVGLNRLSPLKSSDLGPSGLDSQGFLGVVFRVPPGGIRGVPHVARPRDMQNPYGFDGVYFTDAGNDLSWTFKGRKCRAKQLHSLRSTCRKRKSAVGSACSLVT